MKGKNHIEDQSRIQIEVKVVEIDFRIGLQKYLILNGLWLWSIKLLFAILFLFLPVIWIKIIMKLRNQDSKYFTQWFLFKKKYLVKAFLKAKKFLNVISMIKHTQKCIHCQNLQHKCNVKFVKSLDLQDQSFTHTETSQLVFNANKLTGFYVCGTLVLNGLKSKVP